MTLVVKGVFALEKKQRVKIVDEIGKHLYEIIMTRDYARGGYLLECAAVPGSGKTSLLLSLYEDTIERYPDELVFFRDSYNSQCQFNRVEKWHIMAEKGVDLRFLQTPTMNEHTLPVTVFEALETKDPMYYYKPLNEFGFDYSELINKAKKGFLNVVYLKNQNNWRWVIRFLRLYPYFQTILFDEYEDLVPQRSKGEQWRVNEHYAYELKHSRRGCLNEGFDTQHPGDADWRVRSKFMLHAYLRGSKVSESSPVDQGPINSLPVGKMFIEYGNALYGKGSFDPYPPKEPVLIATDMNSIL